MQTNVGATGRVARYTRRRVHCYVKIQEKQSGLDRTFVGPGDQTGRPYILVYWTELGIAKYPTF